MVKNNQCKIGSLNVRSIFKESKQSTRKEFGSFLRSKSLGLGILCLQEVSKFNLQDHLTDDQIRSFSFIFPRCSFLLSKHCAIIICLKPGLMLDDCAISLDERCITATVKDSNQKLLCKIVNSYFPANESVRLSFTSQFLGLPFWQDITNSPLMLMGDFNIHLHDKTVTKHAKISPLMDWLQVNLFNCFPTGEVTFSPARTTIDYLFGHPSLATRLVNAEIQFLSVSWTDHCLLTLDLLAPRTQFGPGSWRFNPTLLDNPHFLPLLNKTVSVFFDSISKCTEGDKPMDHDSTNQDNWEALKRVLQCCAKQFTRGGKTRFKSKVVFLQKGRAEALRLLKSTDGYDTPASAVDVSSSALSTQQKKVKNIVTLIDAEIQNETRESMLRSATRWHEEGERNNKYFYQVIKERQTQQTIQTLKCSRTGAVLTDTADIMQEARGFYQRLYTPDAIDLNAVDSLLGNIPPEAKLKDPDAKRLLETPSPDTILMLLNHTPKAKSPGLDGIPFEVYKYFALNSPAFLTLLTAVLSDALTGKYPDSWKQTRMVLLFKKRDPELLSNWRPLSMISCDARLFTKLLANRFNKVMPLLITPYQTGFMPHRLISDNAWVNHSLMANLRSTAPLDPHVAVLLDQEKAYDRLNADYLARVLIHFGFPAALVSVLSSLFFETQITLSVNGWSSEPLLQSRGVRQGDPLSPLLFTLGIEPLLRTILASPQIVGITMNTVVPPVSTVQTYGSQLSVANPLAAPASPPRIKLLSYADDLEVFLSSPQEWYVLQKILDTYGLASNAKVNLSKLL